VWNFPEGKISVLTRNSIKLNELPGASKLVFIQLEFNLQQNPIKLLKNPMNNLIPIEALMRMMILILKTSKALT
jgi:hypothetical protein